MSPMPARTVTLLDGSATALGTAVVQPNGSWSIPVTLQQWQQLADRARSPIAAGNSRQQRARWSIR